MTMRLNVDLDALPIPATARILLVVTLPHHDGRLPELDVGIIEAARGLAEQVAPGRADVIVLGDGVTLDVLTDAHLANLGLTRTPS